MMKLSKLGLASAALFAAMGAQAQVTGSLGNGGVFVSLSGAGLGGGSIATLSGGTVYTTDQTFADIPSEIISGNSFLAAGPTSGAPATLTFTGEGVDYVSFLWGSPDTYNILTVTTTGGVKTAFGTANLGFSKSNGDQTFSQYVQFNATGGSKIVSLNFDNTPGFDAFESANYSITAPVPEPQTYALLLAGLIGIGFVARRKS